MISAFNTELTLESRSRTVHVFDYFSMTLKAMVFRLTRFQDELRWPLKLSWDFCKLLTNFKSLLGSKTCTWFPRTADANTGPWKEWTHFQSPCGGYARH